VGIPTLHNHSVYVHATKGGTDRHGCIPGSCSLEPVKIAFGLKNLLCLGKRRTNYLWHSDTAIPKKSCTVFNCSDIFDGLGHILSHSSSYNREVAP